MMFEDLVSAGVKTPPTTLWGIGKPASESGGYTW